MSIRIEDVIISESDKENLNQILNSKTTSRQTKELIKKRLYGGLCGCGNVPNKKVIYKIEGAEIIQRFCDECYKNEIQKVAKRNDQKEQIQIK